MKREGTFWDLHRAALEMGLKVVEDACAGTREPRRDFDGPQLTVQRGALRSTPSSSPLLDIDWNNPKSSS